MENYYKQLAGTVSSKFKLKISILINRVTKKLDFETGK